MRMYVRLIPLWMILLTAAVGETRQATAQETATTQASGPEIMTPEQFTQLLKQVWSFLKTETDSYLAAIQKKDEFETSTEFDRKTTDARRQYLTNVIKYSRDQKLDQRVFGVLFKAKLDSYDADKQLYSISSSTIVDAPYNIPTVECTIRKNQYLSLTDSIRAGYRTSSLFITLPRGTKWQVGRDLAKAAKTDEANIYFRANMKIDIEKSDVRDKAILELIPLELAFMNNATGKVYWSVPIR